MPQETLRSVVSDSAVGSASESTGETEANNTPPSKESGDGHDSPSFDEASITTHDPAGEWKKWQEEQDAADDSYSAFVIRAKTARTLSNRYRGFSVKKIIRVGRDCHLHGLVSMKNADPDNPDLGEAVARWAASVLAVPQGEEFRPFDVSRLTVWYPEILPSLLDDDGKCLQAVIDGLQELNKPSLESDNKYQNLVEKKQRLNTAVGTDGDLTTRKKNIDHTIRAKLGYSKRVGSSVPDQHIEFSSWSLDDLAAELEAVREELEEMNETETEVREQVRALRQKRAETIYEENFAPILRRFDDDGSTGGGDNE
jgi:hypothetical protein